MNNNINKILIIWIIFSHDHNNRYNIIKNDISSTNNMNNITLIS